MAPLLLLLLFAPDPAVEEAEAKAQQALTDGDKSAALAHYEAAIRAEKTTPGKARLRDAYRKVGWVEPGEPSEAERRFVGGRPRGAA